VNKVYLLEVYMDGDWRVEGIYSSFALAEKAGKKICDDMPAQRCWYDIDPMEVITE